MSVRSDEKVLRERFEYVLKKNNNILWHSYISNVILIEIFLFNITWKNMKVSAILTHTFDLHFSKYVWFSEWNHQLRRLGSIMKNLEQIKTTSNFCRQKKFRMMFSMWWDSLRISRKQISSFGFKVRIVFEI